AARGELGSSDVDITHDRLGDLWAQTSRRSSPHESALSYRQHLAALCCLSVHDGRNVAQRDRRGIVRLASLTCRICGMGRRAQGRAECIFLAAHDADLREI